MLYPIQERVRCSKFSEFLPIFAWNTVRNSNWFYLSVILFFVADGNRTLLLDAGLPQSIVSLLEGYCENIPSPPYDTPLELSTSRLRIIRTAIGVLLNASLGHGIPFSR